MIPAIPTLLPMPFAQNGEKRAIPEENTDPGSANASWATGFPPVTRINKQAGGKPPYGLDFQGIFNALSQHLFFGQSGAVYPWMGADAASGFPGLNYLKGCHVLGSDGEEYLALQPSGPDVPSSTGGFVGPVNPVGDTTGHWTDLPTYLAKRMYVVGEVYTFLHPDLKPGFMPCYGGVVQNVDQAYPEAWAYFQTTAGQKMCCTEAEWQAMTHAVWHTNADGSKVGWNGIGGAPKFVLNITEKSLRMPDLRGMVEECTGGPDSPGVGQARGDGSREIYGSIHFMGRTINSSSEGGIPATSGAFTEGTLGNGLVTNLTGSHSNVNFSTSRVGPTSKVNRMRSWGSLVCAYLGTPGL